MDMIDPAELRDAASRLLTDAVDRRAPWAEGAGAADGQALTQAMVDLGWLMLTVPEDHGGLGQDFAALAPIYEEMGRALSPVSLAGAMAAVDVLAASGDAAAPQWLAGIADGTIRFVVAETAQTGPRITAAIDLIEGAQDATHVLFVQADGQGPAVIAARDQAGVIAEPVPTWDRGRRYGSLRLTGAEAQVLAGDGVLARDLAAAHRNLAIAWDNLGGAVQALQEVVDYMGTRQQFGRPIGSFQALKHRAADLKVHLEVARALVAHATKAYVARSDGWQVLAGQARLLAGEAYSAIAEDTVQLHGGVGFTWEFDCHLFLKRALMNGVVDGTPEDLRDRCAPHVVAATLAL